MARLCGRTNMIQLMPKKNGKEKETSRIYFLPCNKKTQQRFKSLHLLLGGILSVLSFPFISFLFLLLHASIKIFMFIAGQGGQEGISLLHKEWHRDKIKNSIDLSFFLRYGEHKQKEYFSRYRCGRSFGREILRNLTGTTESDEWRNIRRQRN